MKNLLTIDIGNTSISLGIFKGAKLSKRCSIVTGEKKYKGCLKKIFLENKIDDIIICSVVPQALKEITDIIRAIFGKWAHIINKNIEVPVINLYHKPKEVGGDRLVNAYAGIMLFGSPLIIIDSGTAVTFDVISKNEEYLGGMILPGLDMSLKSLSDKTALLPKIKLKEPKEFIGTDTESSILSGVVNGFSAAVYDLTQKIKRIIGKEALVIGTGGSIDFVSKFSKNFNKIDKDLTLKGLYFIYMENKKARVKK